MKRKIVLGSLLFFGLFFLAGQAMAVVDVIDLNQSDANAITGVNLAADHTDIYEDYGETTRVPYPSHDGYGIVNQDLGWFDKEVINNGETGIWVLDFFVTNTGPYTWSDYHFEFWDSTFTNPLDVSAALVDRANFRVPSTGPLFLNSDFDGTMVSWWAPEWQQPGEEQQFNLYLDLDLLPSDFGIRQVATTVPLPSALLLLGGGLLGLLGVRKRK